MAVLSDKNLKEFKTALDDLEKQTKNWDKCLTDASNSLNKSVGKTFKAEYEMGKNAAEKMQTVLGLLKTLQGDLSTLVVTAEVYYDECAKASKKAASSSKTNSSSSKKTTSSSSTKSKTNIDNISKEVEKKLTKIAKDTTNKLASTIKKK